MNDVSGPHECLVGGSRVTDVRIKRHVRVHFRPNAHGSGLGRVDAFGTGRKYLVFHLDEFGGLPGDRKGFCNDKCDALADETHSIAGKWIVRCDEDRPSIAVG